MPKTKSVLLFYGGWEEHQPAVFAELLTKDLASKNVRVTKVDHLDCLNS